MIDSNFTKILNSQPTHRIDTNQMVPAIERPEVAAQGFRQNAPQQNKDAKVATDTFELTDEEKKIIQELKARDREVRVHEQQHRAAAGQYARSMSFDYQVGPDNQRYAVGGQVNLDTSAIPNDPEATIEKMKQIKRAALAPAEPSGKDRQVAAQSDREIMKQQAKLEKLKREEAAEAYAASGQSFIQPTINIMQAWLLFQHFSDMPAIDQAFYKNKRFIHPALYLSVKSVLNFHLIKII